MPAVPTTSNGSARRTSLYGRGRASSSGSSSSMSSHGQNSLHTSLSNSSTSSTSKTSSSAQRSSSPLSKKQAAVAAAANAASKRLLSSTTTMTGFEGKANKSVKKGLSENLRVEARQGTAVLDEPEYHDEVLEHMFNMEEETRPSVDLMDAQPELRWYMRPYLVDFIVEIHQTFRLRPETLFLTMNIVDRYVSKRIVYKRHYQLVGCAALLIAAKFEDAKDKVPLVSELAQMCCSAYDESAFVQMEGHVLSTIGWTLGHPTPEAWLRLSCAVSETKNGKQALFSVSSTQLDARTLNMTRFLLEVTLFTRDFIGLTPSNLTAGCLLLARIIANQGQDKRALVSLAKPEAIQVAQMVDAYLIDHSHELSEILVKKYSFSHFGCASTAIVQWYITFVAQRDAQRSVLGQSEVSPLLPAVCFTATPAVIAAAQPSATSAAMTKSSSSSFSTPRRSAEDLQDDEEEDREDDNTSMRSRSTTPSSMISTPSQMSTDGEDDGEDDDEDGDCSRDDEDDESDMPVTPLSLNSLHDPLVAAESKENNGEANATGRNSVVTSSKNGAEHHLQPRNDRRALSLSQQDNRLIM